MGEHLHVVSSLPDAVLVALVERELASLQPYLTCEEGAITGHLATGNEVFFTFAQIARLYQVVERHPALAYGVGHETNLTPRDLLRDRASLYLGPWDRPRYGTRVRVPPAVVADLDHLCRNTDGLHGARAGARGLPCPLDGESFLAPRVGFAWDFRTNHGRHLYRCPSCPLHFSMGEHATPAYQELAHELARYG